MRFEVKYLLHEEVDMAEVNKTQVDRYLLAVFRPNFLDFSHEAFHPVTIPLDGIWRV